MTSLKVVRRADLVLHQSGQITAIRDAIRDEPITLDDGRRVDADRVSIDLMIETLEMWDSITQMKTAAGEMLWKDAANLILAPMTRTQFEAFVTEVRMKRAARYDVAFRHAEQLRAFLPVSGNHSMFERETWPN